MNHQSDYGYAIGGVEARDHRLCAQRARFSLNEARKLAGSERPYPYNATWWRENAKAWIREGKAVRRV